MTFVRIIVAIAIAAVINWGLLFVMQYLIATGKSALSDDKKIHFVDFVRVKREETVETKQHKPKKPPKPDEPPPSAPPQTTDSLDPGGQVIGVSAPTVGADINISGSFGYGNADGDYLPIVKVAPIYPRRALSRGIEGWVLLEFTVTKLGTVVDVKVVDADPPNIFDSAAIKAAEKFKYKPKVVDGEPIDTAGVLHRITFQLED